MNGRSRGCRHPFLVPGPDRLFEPPTITGPTPVPDRLHHRRSEFEHAGPSGTNGENATLIRQPGPPLLGLECGRRRANRTSHWELLRGARIPGRSPRKPHRYATLLAGAELSGGSRAFPRRLPQIVDCDDIVVELSDEPTDYRQSDCELEFSLRMRKPRMIGSDLRMTVTLEGEGTTRDHESCRPAPPTRCSRPARYDTAGRLVETPRGGAGTR